jgi:hypothetical protein
MVFARGTLGCLLGRDEVMVGLCAGRSRGMGVVRHVGVVDRASEQWWRRNGEGDFVEDNQNARNKQDRAGQSNKLIK